jgi:hypothetical protein
MVSLETRIGLLAYTEDHAQTDYRNGYRQTPIRSPSSRIFAQWGVPPAVRRR